MFLILLGLIGCEGGYGDSGLLSGDPPPGSHLGNQSGSESAEGCIEISRATVSDWGALPQDFERTPGEALQEIAGPWLGTFDDGETEAPLAAAILPRSVAAVRSVEERSGEDCSPWYAVSFELRLTTEATFTAWGAGDAAIWDRGGATLAATLDQVEGALVDRAPLALSASVYDEALSGDLFTVTEVSLGLIEATRP